MGANKWRNHLIKTLSGLFGCENISRGHNFATWSIFWSSTRHLDGICDNCSFFEPPSIGVYKQKNTSKLFGIVSRMYVQSLRWFGGKLTEIIDVDDWGARPEISTARWCRGSKAQSLKSHLVAASGGLKFRNSILAWTVLSSLTTLWRWEMSFPGTWLVRSNETDRQPVKASPRLPAGTGINEKLKRA